MFCPIYCELVKCWDAVAPPPPKTMKVQIIFLHPVGNAKICQLLEGVFPATIFRKSIRNEKTKMLAAYQSSRISFCLAMDILEADYYEYQDVNGLHLENELIHE